MKKLFLVTLIFALAIGIASASDIGQTQSTLSLEELKAKAVESGNPDAPPMLLGRGGPDAFGYMWVDSDEGDGPVYDWIDISGDGTEITTWNGTVDDGYVTDIPIGTTFNFYGMDYTSVTVSTNGWISFLTQTSNYLSNSAIPNTANPNAIVAVEWDDLDGGTVGHCYYYYDAGENRFIVSWVGWPYYPDPTDPHDLQVILDADDMSITTQYGNNASAWQTDVTVGIENETGTDGLQVANGVAYLRNDLALKYYVPQLAHDMGAGAFAGVPGSGEIGTPITAQVTFRNWGENTETNIPVRLIITPGTYNQTYTIATLDAGQTANVTFPSFTPTTGGLFTFTAIAELPGDGNVTNDTSETSCAVFDMVFDFESGNGGFVADGEWQWGTPTSGPNAAYSGVNCWATNLSGNYSASTVSQLILNVHAGNATPAIAFAHWYDTEANYDGGHFSVSIDGGSSWTVISPTTGYDNVGNASNPLGPDSIFTGHVQGFWEVVTFPLTDYLGADLLVRLAFGSDGSIQYPGWYIDDMGFVDCQLTSANIGVVPSSISGRATQGGSDQDTLTITNSGSAPLIVDISTQMNRVSGTTPPPVSEQPNMEVNSGSSSADDPYDPPMTLDIVCPTGSLFGQDPTLPDDPNWTFGTTDVDPNYIRYESLTGLAAEVNEIHFWGIDAYYQSGWFECDEDPADFQIIFYLDNGGVPGDVVATYDLTITGEPTGQSFSGFVQKEYVSTLTPPVTMFDGWVSIQGVSADGCWFLWQNSPTGDGSSLVFDGTTMTVDDIDLAVCMVGEVQTPWLSVGTDHLVVAAGGTEIVTVLMSAVDQEPGTLTGNVVLSSNDPDNSIITIPVTFVIDPLGIDDNVSGLPKEFALSQNYPNPFNPTTEIKFAVPAQSRVRLEVFNLLGQRVRTLVDAEVEPGYKSVTWDGTNDSGAQLSSGAYFYILKVDGAALSKKMTMIK
jgi:hypothetical protein